MMVGQASVLALLLTTLVPLAQSSSAVADEAAVWSAHAAHGRALFQAPGGGPPGGPAGGGAPAGGGGTSAGQVTSTACGSATTCSTTATAYVSRSLTYSNGVFSGTIT